jgi:hypothetical protein
LLSLFDLGLSVAALSPAQAVSAIAASANTSSIVFGLLIFTSFGWIAPAIRTGISLSLLLLGR